MEQRCCCSSVAAGTALRGDWLSIIPKMNAERGLQFLELRTQHQNHVDNKVDGESCDVIFEVARYIKISLSGVVRPGDREMINHHIDADKCEDLSQKCPPRITIGLCVFTRCTIGTHRVKAICYRSE